MKTVKTLIVAVLACGSVQATEFNLANDFSTNANPSGVWTYGWFHSAVLGLSDLEFLEWNTEAWSETNGVAIWKNETGSAVGNVAPGQVALDTILDEPVVIRWTAPIEIGLAIIQIDGELPTPISDIEIRRGAGLVLSVTNTSTFSVELMVEPGDEIDFVAMNGGTKPLDLTITTLKEHLDITTFDDFDRQYAFGSLWPTVPGWGNVRQVAEGTNFCMSADFITGWQDGAYREMPFSITTNTSLVSFRYISSFHATEGGSFAATGLRFCDDTITTGATRVVECIMRVYPGGGDPTNRVYFTDGEGASLFFEPEWDRADKVEFRADMDFSYMGSDGKHGLFSLFVRPFGSMKWIPTQLQQIEMKVADPTSITKVCANVWHDSSYSGGYNPYLDDIRYCTGENPNRGAGTNLLLGSSFDLSTTPWRTDGEGASRISGAHSDYGPFHDGDYLYSDSSYTMQVYQVVGLLGQGFSAENIDSNFYRVAFGGGQYGTDGGQIGIDFLDMGNQIISSTNLPTYDLNVWDEQMATNAIPPQTRSIRYNFVTTTARIDDAYLSVLGIPQDDVALTVSSALGSPVPAIGTHSNTWGTAVNCSVTDVVNGQTQYECIGWAGTGSVPATGTTNAVEVTLTEHSSMTWNWQTNYWLEVSTSGSGTVDGISDFYAKDSEQTLTATPDAGWLFMGWSGDASGTNEALVMMTEPQVVMATFSDDADGDGLLNSNETAIGSNPWNSDSDGDGFDDAFEVAQGLNVTNDSSAVVDYIQNHDSSFGLYASNVVLDVAMGEILLDIIGNEASLNLQLKTSDDLITWTDAGSTNVWSWTVGDEKKFFRVRSGK